MIDNFTQRWSFRKAFIPCLAIDVKKGTFPVSFCRTVWSRTRNKGQCGIRVSRRLGDGGGGFKIGIRVSEDGGLKFSICQPRNCFSFLPFSNAHCFRHPVRFNEKKVQKVAKHGAKVFFRVVPCRLCPTTQRVYSIVYSQTLFSYGDLYSGSMFSIEGVSDFTTIERRSQTLVVFRVPWTRRKQLVWFSGRCTPSGDFRAAQSYVDPYCGFYSMYWLWGTQISQNYGRFKVKFCTHYLISWAPNATSTQSIADWWLHCVQETLSNGKTVSFSVYTQRHYAANGFSSLICEMATEEEQNFEDCSTSVPHHRQLVMQFFCFSVLPQPGIVMYCRKLPYTQSCSNKMRSDVATGKRMQPRAFWTRNAKRRAWIDLIKNCVSVQRPVCLEVETTWTSQPYDHSQLWKIVLETAAKTRKG